MNGGRRLQTSKLMNGLMKFITSPALISSSQDRGGLQSDSWNPDSSIRQKPREWGGRSVSGKELGQSVLYAADPPTVVVSMDMDTPRTFLFARLLGVSQLHRYLPTSTASKFGHSSEWMPDLKGNRSWTDRLQTEPTRIPEIGRLGGLEEVGLSSVSEHCVQYCGAVFPE